MTHAQDVFDKYWKSLDFLTGTHRDIQSAININISGIGRLESRGEETTETDKKLANNLQRLTDFLASPVEPIPAPVIIDGIEIFPDLTYTASLISKATGLVTSSGLFNGSDLIRLKDTNVTIRMGIALRVEQEPTLEPQNPFYRDNTGEQIFVQKVTIL